MAGYSVSSVKTGKYTRQVSVAASGPQGAQGPAGAQGPKGDVGAAGGLSAKWKFLNSYSEADPGTGYFALNDSSIFLATKIYISDTDMMTDEQVGLLETATDSTSTKKSIVTIQDASNLRKFSRYYVTGYGLSSGWRSLTVEYIDGSARSWAYNDQLNILITPIGDRGLQGPTGPQGIPGPGVPSGGRDGQVLKKVGSEDYATQWVDPSIDESAISNLVDVNLTSLNNGQLLSYSQENSLWENVSSTQLDISGEKISGIINGGSANDF